MRLLDERGEQSTGRVDDLGTRAVVERQGKRRAGVTSQSPRRPIASSPGPRLAAREMRPMYAMRTLLSFIRWTLPVR